MKSPIRLSMKTRRRVSAAFLAGVMMLGIVALVPRLEAQNGTGKTMPYVEHDFHMAAPRGFGDRNNSWPQSMIWWHDRLYVGTTRQSLCTSLAAVYQYALIVLGPSFKDFVDMYLPYPPLDPDLSCPPDYADLSLQAEIWRWTPGKNWKQEGVWDRVFQSPLDLDNPGAGPPAPPEPRVGKKLPHDVGFRGMAAYTESDGTEALYAFGVNSTILWDTNILPPPRILRTTDGVNWEPIPQDEGTFLRDLPFDADHSSYRSPEAFEGKLFVLSGPVFGQGYLIASANPKAGNDAWYLAGPSDTLFYEMESFNGYLYLGSFDPAGGYSVLKTRAQGPPPYQFTTVIPNGAYLTDRPSPSVVSMYVSDGRLFVGTATQTEIIRINPDDTWDLVVGSPRQAPSPDGGLEWKYPISNLDAGFGHTLNDHAWTVEDPFHYLYFGTYNAATSARFDPTYGALLEHNMGAHLYRTGDSGWDFTAVTTTGFADAGGPFGGRFDYGIREMQSTPLGLFAGTANDYYGLGIFRANNRSNPELDPPESLGRGANRKRGRIALLGRQALRDQIPRVACSNTAGVRAR